MRRALLLCGALLAAGPACALRAHDYIDEQRGPVTLPAHPAVPGLNVGLPLDGAAMVTPVGDAGLAPPAGAHAPAPSPPSPVPEPSGWQMLGLGALLLLMMPRKRDDGAYAIRR